MKGSPVVAAVGALMVLVGLTGSLARADSASGGPWSISSNPVWSPDGKAVAWAEVDSAGTRYRIETATASARAVPHAIFTSKPFPGGCCDPLTWTKSGRILYIANFTLYSLRAGGGQPTVLFHGSTPQYIVSPNQETVALVDGCGCGHATDKIAFVNVRGGTPYVLPVARNVSDDPVTFSPDGTELVFVAATFNPATGQFSHRRLMAVHAGGGTPIPLAESGVIGARYLTTHMSSPTWSPDGNWIAAWLDTGTALRLVTINTHNGRKAYAAPAHTQAWTVSWSPDASRLAYAATLRLGDHAQFSPATVDPDGSHRKVFWNRSSGLYYSGQAPAWSPDGSEVLFFAAHGEAGPAQLLAAAADGTGFMQIH